MLMASVRAAFAVALTVLAPGFALAGSHALPARDPVVSVTFPDDWPVVKRNMALEVAPRNRDMYVAYTLVSMGDFNRAMKAWDDWAARSQIKLSETNKSVKKFQFEGGDSISHRWIATDRNGPTIVMRTILKLSDQNLLFITEWGAAPATQVYASELQAIRQSVTKLK